MILQQVAGALGAGARARDLSWHEDYVDLSMRKKRNRFSTDLSRQCYALRLERSTLLESLLRQEE